MNPRLRATTKFLVAAGGGMALLRSLPAYAAVHVNVQVALALQLLPTIAAIGLLWYVVRRRDLTVTAAAMHLAAALWMGWVLSAVLTRPVAQAIAPEVTWRMIAIIAGIGILVSPLIVLVAAAAVRLCRLLPGSGKARTPQPTTPTDLSAPAT
jgi:Mg2+/Co2+ transporter CorB